ncbi:hypothetical protein CsSME_00014950 [Camellia sinensis var. sinensis]
MGFVREFCQKSKKVTGCVVALLYWLCEHTNIVTTAKPIMFLQFLKWNVSTLLARTRGLDLTSTSLFEVRPDRLVSELYEKVIIAGEDFDGREDENFDEYGEVGAEDRVVGTDQVAGGSGDNDDMSLGDEGNDGMDGKDLGVEHSVRGICDSCRSGAYLVGDGRGERSVRVNGTSAGGSGCTVRGSSAAHVGGEMGKLDTALVEIDELQT